MKSFKVVPEIKMCQFFSEFVCEINEKDLILTDRCLFEPFIASKKLSCHVIVQDDYGMGEPTDSKIDKIMETASKYEYNRVIAIGGGTAIDIAKIIVLSDVRGLRELFQREIPIKRERELIIIPTTCGTGSEMTNISIVAFEQLGIKIGLAADELYANTALLIPEFLMGLPYKFFVFSSVDALIHSIESYLSPKATPISRFFSVKAMKMILSGYMQIRKNGDEYRKKIMDDFLLASTYAGIAFGNAGCGLIHAMSYPLSGEYHIAHGEANHQLLLSVMEFYKEQNPGGEIKDLYNIFTSVLGNVSFDELIKSLIDRKPLSTYGATDEVIKTFARQVEETQGRLTANAYVPTSIEQMINIYRKCI